jgi:hypothetical protein
MHPANNAHTEDLKNLYHLPVAGLILGPLPGSYSRGFAQPPIFPLRDNLASETEYEMPPGQFSSAEENADPPLSQPTT